MLHQLDNAELTRLQVSPDIAVHKKAEFGQFMTPSSVARFMAGMFPAADGKECRLLDAGAGVGSLTCAFLDRWLNNGFSFKSVETTAYEIDAKLRRHLAEHLTAYSGVESSIVAGDYILMTSSPDSAIGGFTHAILNPPYKKINVKSDYRLALRNVGIETVNLYTAFVALAVSQLAPGGQLVAIVPRSWCNGPYYRPFREFVLERCALRQIHLFDSRKKAFKDDAVLQENVIIRLERGARQGEVSVSTSTDDSFSDIQSFEHAFDRIVLPGDAEKMVNIPTDTEQNKIDKMADVVKYSLVDLGLSVSTGPVVDFRLLDHLRAMPGKNTIPLLYAAHFSATGTTWPIKESKKPNAIELNDETDRWMYPVGHYCVVRRFSSKEERRRIFASFLNADAFKSYDKLGLENHLNLFHEKKRGLSKELALGLVVYLNTTAVDENFRRSSGNTQVNATDLKSMKYPSRETLIKLGGWAAKQNDLSQEIIDDKFGSLVDER